MVVVASLLAFITQEKSSTTIYMQSMSQGAPIMQIKARVYTVPNWTKIDKP